VIILGREQPSVRAAERLAMAIWYDTAKPIQCIPAGSRGQPQYPYRFRPYVMRRQPATGSGAGPSRPTGPSRG
jgi:hypothetical protein